MKYVLPALFIALAACSGGGTSRPTTTEGGADAGHAFYSEGKFDAAEKELEKVVAREPKNNLARRLLGRVYLLKGRNREAAEQFLKYVELIDAEKEPADAMTLQDLFWAFYRLDDYRQTAQAARLLFDMILFAKYSKMESLRPPYTMTWNGESSTIWPDERTGLYPLKVNGESGAFAIDFGGGELTLDRDFARRARAVKVGVPRGISAEEQGYVDSVDVPSAQIRNVPVVINDIAKVNGRKVDGVIGVGFLYHFCATIDGRRGRLTLRQPGQNPSGAEELPLYFAGDRTLFTTGFVDGMSTQVLVNPTLSGVRFIPSPGLLQRLTQAKIQKVQVGSLSISPESMDSSRFPTGLDGGFGFLIGGLLGADAFKGRLATFDFRRMKLILE